LIHALVALLAVPAFDARPWLDDFRQADKLVRALEQMRSPRRGK